MEKLNEKIIKKEEQIKKTEERLKKQKEQLAQYKQQKQDRKIKELLSAIEENDLSINDVTELISSQERTEKNQYDSSNNQNNY